MMIVFALFGIIAYIFNLTISFVMTTAVLYAVMINILYIKYGK